MSEKPCIDNACGYCRFLEEEVRTLKAQIAGGMRVYAKDVFGGYSAMVTGHKSNATLLLDE